MMHAECHILPIINDKPTLMVFNVGAIYLDDDGNFMSYGVTFQEINNVGMKYGLEIYEIKDLLVNMYKTDYDTELDMMVFFDKDLLKVTMTE